MCDYGVYAYMWALGTIGGICGLSWISFSSVARPGVNPLRLVGAFLAIVGLVVCYIGRNWGLSLYISLLLLQIVLWVALIIYLRIGYDEPPVSFGEALTGVSREHLLSLVNEATMAAARAASHSTSAAEEATNAANAAEQAKELTRPKR